MGRFLKVAGIIFFGLVILIGIPGYYFIHSFDLNKYKSYAADLVEKELGRKLSINGDASIGISLVPTIIINDVELANAEWASNPQMIKVKSLEVKFALAPLFKKQIVIDKVLLNGPEVFLEVSADGKANWDFSKNEPVVKGKVKNVPVTSSVSAADKKAIPAAAALAGFAAKNVSIDNGVVQYNDLQAKQNINLIINNIRMSAESMDSDLTAEFNVVYNNDKVTGNVILGSLNSLLSGKEAYPVSLSATAFNVDAELAGNVVNVLSNPSFAFNANIYNPAGNFGAPETTLKTTIEGSLVKVKADIQTLNIVNNLITGTVSADLSGNIPSIAANLKSDKINLANFSQNSNFAFEFPSLISEAQAVTLVPETAIPYSVMKTLNAKLNLNVKELVIEPGMTAQNLVVGAVLQNGILAVNPLKLNFGGGDINADLKVNANTQTMSLKADSKNMLLQNLHKEFVVEGKNDFGIVSGGNVDLHIDISGSGATYRQLSESLKGQAIAIVGESKVNPGTLKFLEGNFITQILNALKLNQSKSQEIDLKCGVVRTDLGGGKALFPNGIVLNAAQLTIVSDGNVNLVNDKIDFSIRPFSGKLVDTNITQALSSFVKIKGTLEKPSIAIDDKQAIKTIVGVATAGPVFLGTQLAFDADGSPCYTALQGTPYASRFPKPTGVQAAGQDVYKDTSAAVNQGIKDLKKTGQDIIDIFRNKKKGN